jgi:hypothetical protein
LPDVVLFGDRSKKGNSAHGAYFRTGAAKNKVRRVACGEMGGCCVPEVAWSWLGRTASLRLNLPSIPSPDRDADWGWRAPSPISFFCDYPPPGPS